MMIRLIKYICILLLTSAVVISCRGKDIVIDSIEKQMFLEESRIGCYIDGNDYMVYSPKLHQISSNARRNNIRIQTDDQREFCNLKLESFPRTVGVNILGEVTFGNNGVISEYTIVFECSKIESNHIWLWNKESQIGLLVPINK